jgi:hypothetical protein
MSKKTMIDIRVPITGNEIKKSVIDRFEREQAEVQVSTTRDLATVITVASSIVTLLKGVLELYEKYKQVTSMEGVELEDADGNILQLQGATPESIEAFVTAAAAETSKKIE